jgi:hypothetical protein
MVLLMIRKNGTASVLRCASVLQDGLQKTFGVYNPEQFLIGYTELEFRMLTLQNFLFYVYNFLINSHSPFPTGNCPYRCLWLVS